MVAPGLVAAAVLVLCGSFLVTALDNVDAGRFERARGDSIAEYEIVVKEGLELLGWSLVGSRSGTRRSVGGRGRAESRLQRELLEHGLHRDDVPLEAELRIRQACRDPDQLR